MEQFGSVKEIQSEAQRITNSSLDATRRIARTAIETQETATATSAKLADQTDQLNRIENANDDINNGLRKSEKHLQKMESLCCCIYWPTWCWCAKRNYRDSNYSKLDTMGNRKPYTDNPVSVSTQPNTNTTTAKSTGKFIERITNSPEEDEMEDNLTIAADAMADIKQQALAMSDTLDGHNAALDRINAKTDSNLKRSYIATKRTHDLL